MPALDEPVEPSAHGPYATREEVEASLKALTPRQNRDLLRWARYNVQKSGNKLGDEDDLLSEIVLKLLDEPPERKWYPKKIEFIPFLKSAMRSLANSWFKTAKKEQLPPPVEGKEKPSFELEILNERRACLARQTHKYALPATNIFDLLYEGYQPAQVQERLGIAPHIYRAIVKWMREILEENGYGR